MLVQTPLQKAETSTATPCASCSVPVIVQGTFVEAAAPAPVSLQLAAAVLELLSSSPVGYHVQPYVRRAALVAASQVRVCSAHGLANSVGAFQSCLQLLQITLLIMPDPSSPPRN